MTDSDEILRLRARCDELDKRVWGFDYLTKSQGRGIGGLRDELRTLQAKLIDLEKRVDGMTHSEQIADAVTSAIRADRKARWSISQRLATGSLAVLLAVPTAVQVAHWIGIG